MKLNITHKGKKIGEGYLPDIQTKPSENYIHKITQYETTINDFNDFEDQTDLFKAIYKEHRKSLNSTNKTIQNKTALTLIDSFEAISGRKLTTKEQKTIMIHCKKAKPQLKINKYGHLFGKRLNASISSDSLTQKGVNDDIY